MFPKPQAAGFWQPAQGLPEGIGAALGDIAPTAKVDNCFSTDWPWQAGQTGVTPSRIRTSNRFPQDVQPYSYRGMHAV